MLASYQPHYPYRVRMNSIGIIDTSGKHYRGLFDSTLILVEDEAMYVGDSHEFVEMFVMFLVILSMYNYIICDAYHSITVSEDLVHHPLEDVLCVARRWTNLNLPHGVLKVVSSDDS